MSNYYQGFGQQPPQGSGNDQSQGGYGQNPAGQLYEHTELSLK